MRQGKKEFKRFLSVVLSAALTVTGGAFGAVQANSTIAHAADSEVVSVPGTDWKLEPKEDEAQAGKKVGVIAVDGSGIKYELKNGGDAKLIGVDASFNSSSSYIEYEVPAEIPVTYQMYDEGYMNNGSVSSTGTTKVTTIANEAFKAAAYLRKLTISEGITTIGKEAFVNPDLKEISIPKSVSDIGKNTEAATDSNQYEIVSTDVQVKVYCWKDSEADKYFQTGSEKRPLLSKEYLDPASSNTPTASPSEEPTVSPSVTPSEEPAASSSAAPSVPTVSPAVSPSASPSMPTASSSVTPSTRPTASVSPSALPSVRPSAAASARPGETVTNIPSVSPTLAPIVTAVPSALPSVSPDTTAVPSGSAVPTGSPLTPVNPDETGGPVIVVPTESPQQNAVVKEDNVSYQIAQSRNSVSVSDMSGSAQSTVKIPSTVTVNGVKYKVTEIGANAFAGNKKVKKVTLGSNVKTIGAGAFKGCINLTSVKFPSNISSVGKNSFSGCKKLKQVSLPRTVKKIGTGAFKNCKSMKKFVIGKTLKQKKGGQEIRYGAGSVKLDISASAFENCVSLRQMVINSLVRRIGNSALKNCKSLRSLIVNSEILKEVAKRALKGVHNCKISVPSVKLKPYSVLFKNKGQGKKVIVAKI